MTKQQILDRIKIIIPKLDDYWIYSDDHKFWREQRDLHREILELQHQLEECSETL